MKIEKSNDEYRVVNAGVNVSYIVFSIFTYTQGNGTLMTTICGLSTLINTGTTDMNLDLGMIMTLDLAIAEHCVESFVSTGTGKSSNGFA